MEHYDVKDAQQQLKVLLEKAKQGQTILIVDDDNQVVQLMPVAVEPVTRKPRKAGSLRGQIKLHDDFDAPLDDFSDYMA